VRNAPKRLGREQTPRTIKTAECQTKTAEEELVRDEKQSLVCCKIVLKTTSETNPFGWRQVPEAMSISDCANRGLRKQFSLWQSR
jgi:hypothetical protein